MSDVPGGELPEDGQPDNNLEMVAGEYVLGTLDAQERARFTARLPGDGGARDAVARWERRFAGLSIYTDAVAPSPELWARIERRLRTSPETATSGVDAPPYLLRSRDRWRRLAIGGMAVAAALVLFTTVRETDLLPHDRIGSNLVAAVNRGGDLPALIVRVNLKTHRVLVRPVSAVAPPGHSLELWFIGDDAAPRSMGLVTEATTTRLLPPNTTAGTGGTFAISVEPSGGSATGAPTGPVIYSGKLVAE